MQIQYAGSGRIVTGMNVLSIGSFFKVNFFLKSLDGSI